MTADHKSGDVVSETSVEPGEVYESPPPERRPERERMAPAIRSVLWLLAAGASYALTLSVASDDYFLLAIPGILGLAVVEAVAVQAVLRRPSRGAIAPYPTDGTDYRGAVKYLHTALAKRYAVLVLLGLTIVAVPLVTGVTYLIPLMGVGLLGVMLATYYWFDQLRWVRQCSRVLDVYSFEVCERVEKVELLSGGRRFLVLGSGDRVSPEMLAREPMGHPHWPERIAEGVWFAGDDVFGGVLLVPGTGELMCMQPVDWNELEAWRTAAGAERHEMAKRAGLDRHSV